MIDLMILVLFGVAYCVVQFQDQKYERFDDTSVAWCCLLHGLSSRPRKYDGFDDTCFFLWFYLLYGLISATLATSDRFDDTYWLVLLLLRGQISMHKCMTDVMILVLFGVEYCVV